MAEREEQHQNEAGVHMQSPKDDMMSCVMTLEAALLPCLPTRGFQRLIDRSPQPSHQIDVERHAKDFMEAAKKLQLYFKGLQREDLPTNAEKLRKEIAVMEEELKVKNEIIKKNERLIQGWKKELKDQLDRQQRARQSVVAMSYVCELHSNRLDNSETKICLFGKKNNEKKIQATD